MSLTTEQKTLVVSKFLRGESVTDVSAYFAVTRSTVEQVLREAIQQLAKLATSRPPADRIGYHDMHNPPKEQTE